MPSRSSTRRILVSAEAASASSASSGELRRRQRDEEVRAVLAKHAAPLAAAVERREVAIRELTKAVSAFPDNLRARIKAAVIAANDQREAELARRTIADKPGFSPGL